MNDQQKAAKLRELAAAEDVDIRTLLEEAAGDSVCPGICLECDATAEVEPDQDAGWCESCGKNTVVSALVLADLI